jgi:DNA helicase-2/ATP-dependent DNA helicase PcrA
MLANKTEIVLGPPGTGKTTYLLGEVEKLLASGMPPERIAFLAFSRQAAKEARARALARFDFKEEQLPWFRTIHSLAFRQTSLSTSRMLKKQDYQSIFKDLDYEFRGKDSETEVMAGVAGDPLLQWENFARLTGVSLREAWSKSRENRLVDDGFSFKDLEDARRRLLKYKRDSGLVDYTDALEEFVANGSVPPVSVLIVDEAQDLSKLQWRVIEKIGERVDRIVIAGDDDQAIFKWAGADVDHFLLLDGTVKILDQSYRIPQRVHRLAKNIVQRISDRRLKAYKPRDLMGEVKIINRDWELNASEGGWLFLARHSHQLKWLAKLCRESGWFFRLNSESSNATTNGLAAIAWENLSRGKTADAIHVAQAFKMCYDSFVGVTNEFAVRYGETPKAPEQRVSVQEFPGVDFSKPWFEAFMRMGEDEKTYFRRCRAHGEKMAVLDTDLDYFVPAEPRIKISTIHGAKGGEADGVYLLTDVTRSTQDAINVDISDESRVFYVGVTRAKERLIIRPCTRPHYNSYSYPISEEDL